MITQMKKISIHGPKTELKHTIDTLKSTGAFELVQTSRARQDATDETDAAIHDDLTLLLARIDNAIQYAQKCASILYKKPRLAPQTTIKYEELADINKDRDLILQLIDTSEELSAKHLEIKNHIERNQEVIKQLQGYANLDIEFNRLHDTEYTFVLAGIIPLSGLARFKSDFDLTNIIIKQFPAPNMSACAVLIGHKDDYPIVSAIFDYDFEKCKLNFNTTAQEKIKMLKDQNAELSGELQAIIKKSCLDEYNLQQLQLYYDYINNELNTETIMRATRQSEHFFSLTGWILQSEQQRVKDLLPNLKVKISESTSYDSPPVHIKGSSITNPYQSITNLYGAPSKNDIDPNPFVAFFYFLFFGVMIGDVGYGIVMSLLAITVLTLLKPKRAIKDLALIVGMGGISAVLWGLAFGSAFGFELSTVVINPIDDALTFLGLTLALGVFHIVSGLILKFYNLMRRGLYTDAICDALLHIIMFTGFIGIAIDMLLGFANPGTYVAITALLLIVLTAGRKNKGIFGKISGGFGGAYSIIKYTSDILSYARLFGLGLVGAVIAMVANTMGGLLLPIPFIGYPAGILIAVIFHAFNLSIGLLSAYVHNARLQFIEFFSKFYEGGGHIFTPLGRTTKYINIK